MVINSSDQQSLLQVIQTVYAAVFNVPITLLNKFLAMLTNIVVALVRVVTWPLVWVVYAICAILNTLWFCVITPVTKHFQPLEAQSKKAVSYEEWRLLQTKLDGVYSIHTWSHEDRDAVYEWKDLQKYKEDLESARRTGRVPPLDSILRSQATRNICSILSPRLYLKSKIQTKRLIHDYIREVRQCIERLSKPEHTSRPDPAPISEEKRRLFNEVRQILGRTTLVLQGGAMLSLCHLGVVKALHRRRLLPRIITATGTGALVGAIVGCAPDNELLFALEGSTININAFIRSRERRARTDEKSNAIASWLRGVSRRLNRFLATGHFFEIEVLAQCVRDNIGDVTFEEAFARSGRVLNITMAKPEVAGTPQLLNYITAPHVIVWSAVAASVATSTQMFAPTTLQCKNEVGVIERYFAADSPSASIAGRRPMSNPRIPMERIGELFDVNHYIISQTRPYFIPFVRLSEFMCQDPILGSVIKTIYTAAFHRVTLLSRLGLVPTSVQRTMIDELIPSTSTWSKFVIAPELSILDYFKIFNFPSPKAIDEWALKGERSVWPKICQIKVRCCVELELDAVYRRDNVRIRGQPVQRCGPAVNGHNG